MSEKLNPIIVFKDDKALVDLIIGFQGHSQGSIGMTSLKKTTVKNRNDKEQLFANTFDGPIFGTSEKFISIGFEYSKSVNNRLVKEGKKAEFVAESLPWGKWLDGSKIIITHTPKTGLFGYYLRYSYLNANSKASKETLHYEDGSLVAEELLDTLKVGFLPPSRKNGRQGTDDEIKVNTVKVAGITTLKFANKTYVRKGFLESEQKRKLTAWLLDVPVTQLEKLKVA